MPEIFSPPLIQAQSWEEAQRKFNEVLRQMARMMNSIYTGANIPTGRIKADAITGAKIADDAVDSEHLVIGSIDTGHLSADCVTAAKILAGTITADEIAANAITSVKILADAITAAKINVVGLDGTSGKIILSQIESGDLDNIDDGSTYAKVNTTDISAGRINLNYGSGGFKIGLGALGTGLDGLVMNDGTYNVVELGEVSADTYKLVIRDSSGNITVDTGSVMGAAAKEWVSASNTITTTSTTYTDITNMSITQTLPKCLVFMWSVVFLDTTLLANEDCRHIFYIDSGTVGIYSGAEIGKHIVTVNMWSQALAAGSHTFKLQWKTNSGGDTAETWNRQLGLIYWEVQ